ncbi:MAG: glycine cleavage system protein R [Pseudomonadales bacterium]|nr:MAG: glycine cleavage system protein R [Pseudomonadales bacterium]
MTHAEIVFTLYAPDKPGIVKTVSDLVLGEGGSWLESSLTRLCGQFAGIVHVRVPAANRETLLEKLRDCAAQDIVITIHDENFSHHEPGQAAANQLRLLIEANDREGIIDEIASALAARQINVEKLTSSCESASMAGYPLFRANLKVQLPEGVNAQELERILESVSDDLMVSIKDGDGD